MIIYQCESNANDEYNYTYGRDPLIVINSCDIFSNSVDSLFPLQLIQ